MSKKKEPRSLFKRLTNLFKSGPIVKRKIRSVDTSIAVPDKTKSSGALLFQKSLSPTYATITANAYNLSERLMRYQDFCFSGDTLVATPDAAGAMKIEDIVSNWSSGQREQWVFAYDHDRREIIPARVTGALCNGTKEVIEVELDDGTVIKCTPEQRIMLRDGSYCEAQLLEVNTALMPLCRTDHGTPYRMIHTKKRWKMEHVMLAEASSNRSVVVGEHVHHKNFVKHDNRPENLEIMSEHDHMSLHTKINNLRFSDPENRQHMSEVMKKRWADDGDLRLKLPTYVERMSELSRQRRIAYNKIVRPGRFNKGRTDQGQLSNANADKALTFQKICDAYLSGDSVFDLSKRLTTSVGKIIKRLQWQGYKNFKDFSSTYNNHKVVSVRSNKETMLVYDLFIEGYSNFAIAKHDDHLGAQGVVFVHNCDMEQCIVGDTKIAIPGGYKTIEELANECKDDPEKEFIVYSYDHNKKQIVPAYAKQARQTCVEDAWRVTFDNGMEIVGTFEHRLMLRDGTFRQIGQLRPGDAMMPFMRREEKQNESYHWIYTMNREDMSNNGWTAEHKLVAALIAGKEQCKHNLMIRHDITFGRILETCERVGFNERTLSKALDVSISVVINCLRMHGFQTFELFAKAYCTCWHNGGWDNKDTKNPRHDHSLTFEHVCSVYERGMRVNDAAKKLNSTHTKVIKRVKMAGYKSWSDFASNYENCKVVSVEHVGVFPMFDLTVDGYKNFATDSVISHNTPEISSALDIISDETAAQDDKGRVLHVFSENEKIKEIIEDLFYNTLNVEFNLRSWVRCLCKFGDHFLYVDVSPTEGVKNAFPIPVNEIEREENYDRNDPFAVRFRWVTLGNRTLENWEVLHFRLLGNDMFLPYGSSMIEGARKIWRQLLLLEDAMLVYRIVRAPERRVFYVDVGNVPPEQVEQYVEQQRRQLRTNQVVDNATGRVDLRYNPLSVDEDILIPVRGADSATKIDTLPGGSNTAAVEDVAYMQKKLFAALKVPKAYLGYDDMVSCLTGDTQVPLLNGEVLTIEQLAKAFGDGSLSESWVYSTDLEGNVKPGRLTNAWATREVNELYHVTLDNGEVIKCTANHPFLCKDGLYRRADELIEGQSLMAVYRRTSSKAEGDSLDGYEMIWQDGAWSYTHKIVNDEACEGKHTVGRQRVVHHDDYNKLNNEPSNLVEMTWHQHRRHHAHNLETTLFRPDVIARREPARVAALRAPKHRALKSFQMMLQHSDPDSALSQWVHGDEIHEKMSSVMKDRWARPDYRAKKSKQNKEVINRPDVKAKLSGDNHWYRRKYEEYTFEWLVDYCVENDVTRLSHFYNITKTEVPIGEYQLMKLLRENGFNRWRDFAKVCLKRNHKVVSVEIVALSEPVWVYDLEVEKWDNFLVSGGIVLHNSKALLAQEDIRFSRTIAVIQKTIIAELNKLAIIHLYANGYDGEDLQNFTLKLSNPSSVAQQQKLELWRAKFEIASSLPEGMGSREFVQHEIWGLSQDQIEMIEKQRIREKKIDVEIEAMGEGGAEGGGDMGGGGDMFGGDMGDEGEPEPEGGGEEPAPEPENAGEEPEEDVDASVELLTSSDEDEDDNESIVLDNDRPIRPNAMIARYKHNRTRRRHHGSSTTHMPDFVKMTGNDSESMKTPFDEPLMLGLGRQSESVVKAALSPDVRSTLKNMESKLLVTRKERLDEATDIQDAIDGVFVDGPGERVDDDVQFSIEYVEGDDDDHEGR